MSETTRALVARFAGQTATSRDSPASYANGRVVRALEHALGVADAGAAWWEDVPVERIRAVARAALEEDTRCLVTPCPGK